MFLVHCDWTYSVHNKSCTWSCSYVFFQSHDRLLWLQNTHLQNTHLPYSSALLHWHWSNHMIAPVPVKQPWRIWVKSVGSKTKQSTANLCIILRMSCMFGPKVGLNVPQQFVTWPLWLTINTPYKTAIQKNIHIPSKGDRTNKVLMRQYYVDMRAKFWKKLQWNGLILKSRGSLQYDIMLSTHEFPYWGKSIPTSPHQGFLHWQSISYRIRRTFQYNDAFSPS